MTELDDAAMDARLRMALGAAPPALSAAFDRRLRARIEPMRPRRGARVILSIYSGVSLVLSAWIVLALPPETRTPVVTALVVAALVGDWEAAQDVQLNLPETGVCSTDLAGEGAACCGTGVSQNVPLASNLISLSAIPFAVNQLQPIALQVATRECGCDDACCGDGIKSTTCGCDTACCS